MKSFTFKMTFLTLTAIFASMFFSACSDFTGGSFSDSRDAQTISVSVSATDEKGNAIKGNGSRALSSISRQILPDPTVFASDENVRFYIYGISSRGKKLADTEVTFDSNAQSVNTIELTYDRWDLTLKAVKTISGNPVIVLRGSITKDLSNGNVSNLEFILSTKNLSGTGSADLKFKYYDKEDKVIKIKAGIYNLITGLPIVTEVEYNPKDSSAAADVKVTAFADHYYAFNYKKLSVPNGQYTFKITFYADDNGTERSCGVWSDLIRIDVGNVTDTLHTTNTVDEENRIVIPDIIAKGPDAAPDNLKVWYIEGSETINNGIHYYNALVTWEDKSSNEECFNLKIVDLGDPADDTDDIVVYSKDNPDAPAFIDSDVHVAGSLLAGNEGVIVKLPTGHLYEFYVQAANWIGTNPTSDFVARLASSDLAAGATGTDALLNTSLYDWYDTAASYKGYAAPASQHVNRVAFTYNLGAGGQLTLASDNAQTGGAYIQYDTYAGSALPLMTIYEVASPQVNYPTLVKDNHPFVSWKKDYVDGPVITETDWHDVNAFANYNLAYSISYIISGYSTLDIARLSAGFDADGTEYDVADCKNGVIDCPVGISGTVTVTVSAPADDTEPAFNFYMFEVGGVKMQASASNTFEINSDELSGTQQIVVYASTTDANDTNWTHWCANSFTIKINR